MKAGESSGDRVNNSAAAKPEAVIAAAAAILALAAVFDLPYGMYTFVRLGLTGAAVTLIVFSIRNGIHGWLLGFVPIALLFNPLFPVYLTREEWLPIDLITALFLVIYANRVSKPRGLSKGPATISPLTNTPATVGFILGIVSFFFYWLWLPGPVAIIFSAIGLARAGRIAAGGYRAKGRGFAIAGLVLGIVYTVFPFLQLAIASVS